MCSPTLEGMPPEMLAMILNHCPARDLIAVKRSSSQLNGLVKGYFEEHRGKDLNSLSLQLENFCQKKLVARGKGAGLSQKFA